MELFHRDLGGEGKPPMVILHGMLGSSRNWQTAGADLAERYHVLAVDFRNHGRSPHAEAMDYAAMMGDAVEWLDTHEIGSAALLGHSMGGKVAMLLACREPQRVSRLIVVDIAPKSYQWTGHRVNFAAMNELNLAEVHSRAEAELRLEGRVTNWAMRKFLTTNLDRGEDGRWRWQINLPVITRALSALESNPLATGDHFEGPARFIVGAKSNYVEAADRNAIKAHFPRAEIAVIASAGHNPHMETREAFVRAVLADRTD